MKLEPCIPPVWASTAHLQTILGHLLPSPRLKSKGKRVEIPVSEGDRLVSFIQEGESDTVVYVFHGLAGSTDSTYIHRTSIVAQQLGHTVILTNHRGCGEGAGLAKGLYHSGRGEDLASVIAYGRKLFPKKRHVAVGYSMSGNALLLLLSGKRGDTQPDAAISVNAPIALEETSFLLGTGFNRIYDIKFYLQCRRDVFKAHQDPEVRKRIPRLSTIREFDNYFTAPFGGFRDREDYYSTCSTQALLKNIKVPTVLLMSKDDPFVPFSSYESATLSPNVLPHYEVSGGHMGYITREKTPLGTFRWQDYAVREALKYL